MLNCINQSNVTQVKMPHNNNSVGVELSMNKFNEIQPDSEDHCFISPSANWHRCPPKPNLHLSRINLLIYKLLILNVLITIPQT